MSNTAELIKSRVKISEIVGKHVALKPKAGGEFVGLCPFHNEKTPSFTVSEAKGFYHCFGCGAHGDIFTFLMEIERLEYKDALKYLAQVAGVTINEYEGAKNKADDKFYKIYQAAANLYQDCLFNGDSNSRAALSYLKERGFSEGIIKKFKVGFAKDYNYLPSKLSDKFNEKDLIESKIVNKGNSNIYDFFAHRIIFPIHDRRGRVIAFGGRILPNFGGHKPDAPKYLNSPDSPIFKKSYNLYGLHQGADSIIKQSRVIIVEGYVDVISLNQFGIHNVVAPLGTSIKAEHVAILSKLCSEIVVCLDGDAAGKRAMMRFIELVLPKLDPKLKIKFIEIPHAQDPDEYVRDKGVESFTHLISQAQNLADFLFENLLLSHNMTTPEGKAAFKAELDAYAKKIEHGHLSKEYGYHFSQKYWDAVKSNKNDSLHTKAAARVSSIMNKQNLNAIHELIALVIAHPELLGKSEIMQILLDAEISDKGVDKIRCGVIEYSDYAFDTNSSNNVSRGTLQAFLESKGLEISGLNFFISRFQSTSLDCYSGIAKKILLKYQLELVSLDIKMLKQRLKDSGDADDFARYSSLIALRSKLKQKKEI